MTAGPSAITESRTDLNTGSSTEPITVCITRHTDPARHEQMLAWLRAGTELAERFDGFLGSGWLRPGAGSGTWHMLYRFADPEALARWEASEQRGWWLRSGDEFVEHTRWERRTGIEGWFDTPSSLDVGDLRPAPPSPPRWKQACAIFLVFFPLSVAANVVLSRLVPGAPLVLRVLMATVTLTPVMTYLALPWITSLLAPWLHAQPRPARRKQRAASRPAG
jgi:antibiotic biosynthesis monooxygenase (ABM) superfamily enzyme